MSGVVAVIQPMLRRDKIHVLSYLIDMSSLIFYHVCHLTPGIVADRIKTFILKFTDFEDNLF